MANVKSNVKVTESVFKAVKILLKSGESRKACAEYMGISLHSVERIDRAEDYEDMRNQVNAYYYRRKKQAEEAKRAEEAKKAEEKKLPPQSSPIVLPQHKPINGEDSYQLVRLMKEQNELLKIISNKMAFIVEDLCGPVKKEG
jgi:DNA invertase Pin-like site-specific DNA recombinase